MLHNLNQDSLFVFDSLHFHFLRSQIELINVRDHS